MLGPSNNRLLDIEDVADTNLLSYSDEAFEEGLDKNGFLKSVSYHQYAARNQEWVRLQRSYMNHTAVADNVTQYLDAIELCHAYDPILPFVLGETNSNSFNLNMSHIEGVFGSALWLIDHLLMGMSVVRTNILKLSQDWA